MEILAPYNSNNIEPYVNAGASEFYLGFFDDQWYEDFGRFGDLNRMSGFKRFANSLTFDEMLAQIDIIKSKGKKAYVTMNAQHYSDIQLQSINKFMPKLKEHSCDGIITSTPEMVQLTYCYGLNSVASTMCAVYNTRTACFFRDLGCKRIILPRDLSIREIESIVNNTDHVEFELFAMRNGCVFSDSFCLGVHQNCGSLCGSLRLGVNHIVSQEYDFMERHNIELTDDLYRKHYKHFACSLCALYRFKELGISALKVVGRADAAEFLLYDIALLYENIKVAQECKSEEEYLRRMILPKYSYNACKCGFSCYYPEVRFGEVQ